jgi:hypothetical protein
MDVLDIDDGNPDPGRVDVGVQMLRTAIAATIPSGARPPMALTPCGRADWGEAGCVKH